MSNHLSKSTQMYEVQDTKLIGISLRQKLGIKVLFLIKIKQNRFNI